MPAHTRLWRSQEGIATLSYPPEPTLRPGPVDMSGDDELNAQNPVSSEPVFDQLFMFIAIVVIGVCVLVLAVVVVRKLVIAAKKKTRRLKMAIKRDAEKDAVTLAGDSTATLVHAVVVALPSPDGDDSEQFRPLCSEKTLTMLGGGGGTDMKMRKEEQETSNMKPLSKNYCLLPASS